MVENKHFNEYKGHPLRIKKLSDPETLKKLKTGFDQLNTLFIQPKLATFMDNPTQQTLDEVYQEMIIRIRQATQVAAGVYPKSLKGPTPIRMQVPLTIRNSIRITKEIINHQKPFKVKPLEVNGDVKSDIRHFYSKLYSKDPTAPPIPPIPEEDCQSILFDKEEIRKFLRKYPSNRAAGTDRLSNRLLRFLEESTLPSLLTEIFNKMSQNFLVPTDFNFFRTTLISKNKNEEVNIKDLRPVGVSNLFRLMYEKNVLEMLNRVLKPHPLQSGFVKRRSTITNLEWLLSTEHPKAQTILFDISKAYDTVDIAILIRTLIKLKVPGYLIKTIQSLTQNTYTRISVNNIHSRIIKRTRGLAQGSLLSPILFSTLTVDLGERLMKYPKINGLPGGVMFADDIATRTLGDFNTNRIYGEVKTWSQEQFLALSIEKTVGINLGDKVLPTITRKESAKYLGLLLGTKGLNLYQYFCSRIVIARRHLEHIISQQLPFPPHVRLTLYKTFIRSRHEYCTPLLSILAKQERLDIGRMGQALVHQAVRWCLEDITLPFHNVEEDYKEIFNMLMLETFLDRADTLFDMFCLKQPTWIPRSTPGPKHNFLGKVQSAPIHEEFFQYCQGHSKRDHHGVLVEPTRRQYMQYRIKQRNKPAQAKDPPRHLRTNIILALYAPTTGLREFLANFRNATRHTQHFNRTRILQLIREERSWKDAIAYINNLHILPFTLGDPPTNHNPG
jgi:hypothetical protein